MLLNTAAAGGTTLPANQTIRISVSSSGVQGNAWSGSNWVNHNGGLEFTSNSISSDGHYVVFTSRASNLTPGDTNGVADVFLRDTSAGTTTLVSLDSSGQQYSYDSINGRISDDGRYVIFSVGPEGSWPTLFERDLQTGTTTQVASSAGYPAMTPDGRFVIYTASSGVIYRWDHDSDSSIAVSVNGLSQLGNGFSACGAISADGRFVAFCSEASNLVSGDTNSHQDVFVRDVDGGTTERVSIDGSGGQFPDWSGAASISSDGRYIAFLTFADNLHLGVVAAQTSEVVLRDRTAGTTTLVSTNTILQPALDDSNSPMITADGRYVVFHSWAKNLVAADGVRTGDTFVWDRVLRTTTRQSVDSSGLETVGNGMQGPAISGNGRYVVFESGSSSLVSGDTNGVPDIFMRDRTGELNDIVAPVNNLIGGSDAIASTQTDLKLAAAWNARDPGSGLAYFDVIYTRAPYNSTAYGSPVYLRSKTLGTGGVFGTAPGYTYCLQARA